ncbi:hypothetical protein [Salinivibrio kushneri]|uniref:hypothetical protein n=1 Tax=Salinivibrio kushneri TaxID=1908198 RepID=UPI0009896AB5|nr:hypothetical protein [Salinivibrio kushneri]OOE67744.1 hypothetical protein BZG19_10180 [Salinivibrio kushneri]
MLPKKRIEFVSELESEIRSTISSCFPAEWDENHLTYSLLKEIRKRFSIKNIFWGNPFPENISWSAYKYNGEIEKKHGDIGILVKIVYRDGSV